MFYAMQVVKVYVVFCCYTELMPFSGVDGQLVIYRCADGLTSSCPLTVISPVPQVINQS